MYEYLNYLRGLSMSELLNEYHNHDLLSKLRCLCATEADYLNLLSCLEGFFTAKTCQTPVK